MTLATAQEPLLANLPNPLIPVPTGMVIDEGWTVQDDEDYGKWLAYKEWRDANTIKVHAHIKGVNSLHDAHFDAFTLG